MKTLLFLPLFFFLLPLSGRACGGETALASISSNTSTSPASPRTESDPSAKKNAGTPAAPAPSAPKRDRAAPPSLFMD